MLDSVVDPKAWLRGFPPSPENPLRPDSLLAYEQVDIPPAAGLDVVVVDADRCSRRSRGVQEGVARGEGDTTSEKSEGNLLESCSCGLNPCPAENTPALSLKAILGDVRSHWDNAANSSKEP